MLVLHNLVLEFFILFFQEGDGVFIVILHLAMLCHDLINFEVLGINHFFKFRVLIIKGFDLVKMLFFEVFNFTMEIEVKLTLQ